MQDTAIKDKRWYIAIKCWLGTKLRQLPPLHISEVKFFISIASELNMFLKKLKNLSG